VNQAVSSFRTPHGARIPTAWETAASAAMRAGVIPVFRVALLAEGRIVSQTREQYESAEAAGSAVAIAKQRYPRLETLIQEGLPDPLSMTRRMVWRSLQHSVRVSGLVEGAA